MKGARKQRRGGSAKRVGMGGRGLIQEAVRAPEVVWRVCVCSGALLPDALARAAHLAVQLDHLEDGLLPTAAQVVEQAVVLLREPVEHAEDEACWEEKRREARLDPLVHTWTYIHMYLHIHTFKRLDVDQTTVCQKQVLACVANASNLLCCLIRKHILE